MIGRFLEQQRAARRLARLDVFEGLSAGQLREVDRLLTEVAIPEGRTVMEEGRPGFDFVVVVEGRAGVLRDGELVAEVGPGSFLGEMALVGGGVRRATVVALEPMLVYVLNPAEFHQLLEVAPRVRERVVAAVRERSRVLGRAA